MKRTARRAPSSTRNSDDDESGVPKELQKINLKLPSGQIHDREGEVFSILNKMHMAYAQSGDVGQDAQAEGFKQSVVAWSSSYYVAYALMMTIAFAMLTLAPEPRFVSPERPIVFRVLHFRPESDVLDALIQLLYVFFAACACFDSTWGMMLCAEWGVRGPVVPPKLYERFIELIDPAKAVHKEGELKGQPLNPKDSITAGGSAEGSTVSDRPKLSSWFLRCMEPRAVHVGLKRIGCFWKDGGGDETGIGWAEAPAWDPFYLVDRTVQSLFFTGVCFVYLTQGVPHAIIVFILLLALRSRVKRHGLVLSFSMMKAAAEAEEAEKAAEEKGGAVKPPSNAKMSSRPPVQKKAVNGGAAVCGTPVGAPKAANGRGVSSGSDEIGLETQALMSEVEEGAYIAAQRCSPPPLHAHNGNYDSPTSQPSVEVARRAQQMMVVEDHQPTVEYGYMAHGTSAASSGMLRRSHAASYAYSPHGATPPHELGVPRSGRSSSLPVGAPPPASPSSRHRMVEARARALHVQQSSQRSEKGVYAGDGQRPPAGRAVCVVEPSSQHGALML